METKIEELFDETVEDMNSRRSSRNIKLRRGTPSSTSKWKTLIIVTSVVILFIVVIIVFFGDGQNTSSEGLESLRERLDSLEKRVAQLESQSRKSQQFVTKMDGSGSEGNEEGRYHTVSSGDTLSGIAERYGLTVPELCRLNQITPNTIIRVGQMLLIGVGSQQ
jgi:LysM repeat protein